MTTPPPARLEAFAVLGLPEVGAGDDLAGLLLAGLAAAGEQLRDGDLVVVSSKVVSKAEGRAVPSDTREQAVEAQSVRVVAQRLTPRGLTQIVVSASGPVLAAAGVDASNVPDGTVLLLPADPDGSARRLLAQLSARTGVRLGVVITDTLGRPWRQGQVDVAIGAAGMLAGQNLSGTPDTNGRPMEVTYRALADEIASAADLVKGKVDAAPVAVVRGLDGLVTGTVTGLVNGLSTHPDGETGGGAATLLRPAAEDWFRYGHAEAARAALGVLPQSDEVPVQPVRPGDAADRLRRAVAVAMASPHWQERPDAPAPWVHVVVEDEAALDARRRESGDAEGPQSEPGEAAMALMLLADDCGPHEMAALGALAQRVLVAAWAEDLDAVLVPRFQLPPTSLAVRAVSHQLDE